MGCGGRWAAARCGEGALRPMGFGGSRRVGCGAQLRKRTKRDLNRDNPGIIKGHMGSKNRKYRDAKGAECR